MYVYYSYQLTCVSYHANINMWYPAATVENSLNRRHMKVRERHGNLRNFGDAFIVNVDPRVFRRQLAILKRATSSIEIIKSVTFTSPWFCQNEIIAMPWKHWGNSLRSESVRNMPRFKPPKNGCWFWKGFISLNHPSVFQGQDGSFPNHFKLWKPLNLIEDGGIWLLIHQ